MGADVRGRARLCRVCRRKTDRAAPPARSSRAGMPTGLSPECYSWPRAGLAAASRRSTFTEGVQRPARWPCARRLFPLNGTMRSFATPSPRRIFGARRGFGTPNPAGGVRRAFCVADLSQPGGAGKVRHRCPGLVLHVAVLGLSVLLACGAFEGRTLPAADWSPEAQASTSAPAPSGRNGGLRPDDELWLVSTRGIACLPQAGGPVPWQVWRWTADRWESAPVTILREAIADRPLPILVFLHGNRVDAALAGQYGWQAYRALVGSRAQPPAVRFIIWSWPSDQIHGPLRDARSKADRSDEEAWLLAAFLAGLPWPEHPPSSSTYSNDVISADCSDCADASGSSERPRPAGEAHLVAIVGYSLGARIGCGALHLLGGGSWRGRQIEVRPICHFRIALWAAAEHSHWLLPGQPHERALGTAERWWISLNPCDPVLSRYRWVDRCERPAALGVVGLTSRWRLPGELASRVEEEDVSGQIGGTHSLHPYLHSGYILEKTRQVLFGELVGQGSADPPEAAGRPRP